MPLPHGCCLLVTSKPFSKIQKLPLRFTFCRFQFPEMKIWINDGSSSILRLRSVEFLIESAHLLELTPIIKYTALSLFADRFYPSLSRFVGKLNAENWLLQPEKESNLQLFALISIWISSKIHESRPLSVKRLKTLTDKSIDGQIFTARDFLEAVSMISCTDLLESFFYQFLFNQAANEATMQETVFLQVLNYEIGAGNITFVFLGDILAQFREVAKVGELVDFEACMDIMDLLYEKEDASVLYCSPCSLAASTLVASYVITVPKLRWEFPVLPWALGFHSGVQAVSEYIMGPNPVNFATQFKEEDILEIVRYILKHVFEH